MLVAVCSDRGAPGVTSTALALAAGFGVPTLLVEADAYGGDLAVRCRVDGDPLPSTPTLLGLGAGRAENPAESPRTLGVVDPTQDGAHQLNAMVRVVPGFLTAEAGDSLAWSVVTSALVAQPATVVADVGRIHSGSPSMPIVAAADVIVSVCRDDLGSVQHMIWRLEQIVVRVADRTGRPPTLFPVVVSRRRRGGGAAARQVQELLAETTVGPTVQAVGALPWDPHALTALYTGGDPWTKPLYASPLMKSARAITVQLATMTGSPHADLLQEQRSRRKQRSTDDNPVVPAPVAPQATHVPPASDSDEVGELVGNRAGESPEDARPSFDGIGRPGRRIAEPTDD